MSLFATSYKVTEDPKVEIIRIYAAWEKDANIVWIIRREFNLFESKESLKAAREGWQYFDWTKDGWKAGEKAIYYATPEAAYEAYLTEAA